MHLEFLDDLLGKKNLLGFSGGVDSVGMFFSLLEENVCFDIAIVNYGLRESSQKEVEYAQEIAKIHNKKCFSLKAPKIKSNFEANARKIRYDFFQDLILTHGYHHLILAHHLNDKLEWFFMQLSKGAGLNTLLGFEGIENREEYKIIRPFIYTPKKDIYEYCKNYKYFEDSSNKQIKYKRNEFRIKYTDSFLKDYCKGIKSSFQYLQKDKARLYAKKNIFDWNGVYVFRKSLKEENIYYIDKLIKKLGYVLSYKQREEIEKTHFSTEIAKKYLIDSNQNYIFVTKIHKQISAMSRIFKNLARKNQIPPRIRPIIYEKIPKDLRDFEDLNEYLVKKVNEISIHCQ